MKTIHLATKFKWMMPGAVRLLLFILMYAPFVQAQTNADSIIIRVSGTVTDGENSGKSLEDLMIVNLTTQRGDFGKAGGLFTVTARKKDTLIIASTGYAYKKICFKDSAFKPEYHVKVKIYKLTVQLKEVKVFSPRDLESINKDIQKLGYNKRDYQMSGVDGLQSPITFLYQAFSKYEKLRRHNAVLVNDEKRRILLMELLSRYVADDIIQLSPDDFDRFVDYCNVPEEFMKTSTQYQFLVYIKQKYNSFSARYDYYREK